MKLRQSFLTNTSSVSTTKIKTKTKINNCSIGKKINKIASLPRMLIHTAEEKDTRRKLVVAMMAQNNTRMLKNRN